MIRCRKILLKQILFHTIKFYKENLINILVFSNQLMIKTIDWSGKGMGSCRDIAGCLKKSFLTSS